MAILVRTAAQLRAEVDELLGNPSELTDARIDETIDMMQQRFAVSLINRYLSGNKSPAAQQATFWISRSTITATANSDKVFLPQDFMRLESAWNRTTSKPLIEMPAEKIDTWFHDVLRDPESSVPGSVTHCAVYDYAVDSGSSKQRMLLRDVPDNAQVIDITYWRIPATPTASGLDAPAWLQAPVIYSAAKYLLFRTSPEYDRLNQLVELAVQEVGVPRVV